MVVCIFWYYYNKYSINARILNHIKLKRYDVGSWMKMAQDCAKSGIAMKGIETLPSSIPVLAG
jgi:hypothetical protein